MNALNTFCTIGFVYLLFISMPVLFRHVNNTIFNFKIMNIQSTYDNYVFVCSIDNRYLKDSLCLIPLKISKTTSSENVICLNKSSAAHT